MGHFHCIDMTRAPFNKRGLPAGPTVITAIIITDLKQQQKRINETLV